MAQVEVSAVGAVATCQIDSPATQNALSPALLLELVDALERLDHADEIRSIVLAGSAEVFATGASVRSLAGREDERAEGPEVAEAWLRIDRIETPIVAAVSGWALGSGFELALACDLIVAAKKSRFGLPDISLGVIPSGGATQRLTRTLGKQLAAELILTGRRMEAEEAHEHGLVNSVVDKRVWLEKAMRVAEGIAAQAPVAVRLAKQAILAAQREGLDAGLALERELYERTLKTEDRVEGVEALLQKRPPVFKNR